METENISSIRLKNLIRYMIILIIGFLVFGIGLILLTQFIAFQEKPSIVERPLADVVSSPDKSVTAWIGCKYDANTNKELGRFVIIQSGAKEKPLPFFANCLTFSPDSKILAISTSEDNGIEETNTIQFYDLRQNKITKIIPVMQTVYSISYTKKGIIAKADFTTYVINPMTYSLSFQTLPN